MKLHVRLLSVLAKVLIAVATAVAIASHVRSLLSQADVDVSDRSKGLRRGLD